jgi:hypothetical protein
MPAELWVYGFLMVIAGLLVWRFAMQYHTYLSDACKNQDTKSKLLAYLGTPARPKAKSAAPADSPGDAPTP